MTAASLVRRLFLLLLLAAPLLTVSLHPKADAETFSPVGLATDSVLPVSDDYEGRANNGHLSPTMAGQEAPVAVLTFSGAIGPATADYIRRALLQAQEMGAQLAVLRLDTPGGLDTAMREIIKDILASPVPVATFVYPSGARAASAGTFILYASHIAAMAPGTTLGAATPVAIGGPGETPDETPRGTNDNGQAKPAAQNDQQANQPPGQELTPDPAQTPDPTPVVGDAMTRKKVEDTVAYIRGLAHLRARNAEWAERAVREAVSLPAEEAVAINVVDLLATDILDLLNQLEGRTVNLPLGPITLATAGATTISIDPDWRNRFLATITNPGVAYILMMIGIYGLLIEFYNPGVFLPGVIGAVSLLLALYAFHLLPISYVGAGLIFLGVAFMAMELMIPAFGILGVGGAVAFIIGSVMLMDTSVPGFTLPWPLIVGATVTTIILLILIINMAMKANRKPLVAGREELIGAIGTALEDFDDQGRGWIRVCSELWRAKSGGPIGKGQQVEVTRVHGLELQVEVARVQGLELDVKTT
ncbi:MAG: nodulation protein NfeD [Desulfobulbaceae bacterium]|nr:MAG: nodulation protein NfeD [Desulfobulbaceae bacterium]